MLRLPAGCPLDCKGVFEALLRQGIIIRPLASFGLPDGLRVSVGLPEENQALVQALEGLLGRA